MTCSDAATTATGAHTPFRKGATEFQKRRRHWGEVALRQTLSTKITAWLIAAAVASTIGFLLPAPYACKETGSRCPMPTAGTARVHAPQPGIVSAVHVPEAACRIRPPAAIAPQGGSRAQGKGTRASRRQHGHPSEGPTREPAKRERCPVRRLFHLNGTAGHSGPRVQGRLRPSHGRHRSGAAMRRRGGDPPLFVPAGGGRAPDRDACAPRHLCPGAPLLSFRAACGAAGCCPSPCSPRARSRPGRAARAGPKRSG